jgi:hypothetical protein
MQRRHPCQLTQLVADPLNRLKEPERQVVKVGRQLLVEESLKLVVDILKGCHDDGVSLLTRPWTACEVKLISPQKLLMGWRG